MNTKPWDIAPRLRDMAATGDGARHAAILMDAAAYLEALCRVHAELDGREWDSSTLDDIAAHLATVGLEPSEPSEPEEA
jgi:hypothetical protein